MQTENAQRERRWGSFPALRQALEAKSLSGAHYGVTSVSDNFFERLHRTLEIGLLACDNVESVCEAARSTGWNAMHHDLERLASELDGASVRFQEEAHRIRALHSLER